MPHPESSPKRVWKKVGNKTFLVTELPDQPELYRLTITTSDGDKSPTTIDLYFNKEEGTAIQNCIKECLL